MDSEKMLGALTAPLKRLRLVSIATLALCATSCRMQSPITTTQASETITRETVRDSIIYMPSDSAWLRAWLECDSSGNVLMRQMNELRGKRSNISRIKLTPDKNTGYTLLELAAVSDSLALRLQLKDKEIERLKSNTVTITVPAEIRWWQKSLMAGGVILIIIIAAITAVIIARRVR